MADTINLRVKQLLTAVLTEDYDMPAKVRAELVEGATECYGTALETMARGCIALAVAALDEDDEEGEEDEDED